MLYEILAITGGLIGLLVTGAAVYTVWQAWEESKRGGAVSGLSIAKSLGRWTVMDYAALLIFGIGALFLFSDLLAVMRDRDSYPYYHYGYLFVSFIFTLIGMLFMTARLAVLLRSDGESAGQSAGMSALHYENGEPYEADKSE